MLNVSHDNGSVEVDDGHGRRVVITIDDQFGGLLVTFPSGAATRGLCPFAFAFDDDLSDECKEPFSLGVRPSYEED